MAAMRVLLWDIDHTLLTLPGVGGSWYSRVLRSTLGIESATVPLFAGETERGTVEGILRSHDREVEAELVERMFAALIDVAGTEAATLAQRGRVLPGVETVLRRVHERDTVVQTVVTGNLAPIARYKLDAFDLTRFTNPELGSYGDLSAYRPDLVLAAMDSVARHRGAEVSGSEVTVVGDTPNDVTAALAHGARAVAVATGNSPVAELRAAGAETVLADLSDTERVLHALLGQ
ncbi:MAG: HAD family hydrolase [Sciscionella sp.]